MQILITGSNGFIGSHLNHSLITKKIDTYDITRDEMNNFSLLQSMNNISANMLIHLASNAFILTHLMIPVEYILRIIKAL